MLVFFAALLSAASAAKYCCAPDQWHGEVGLIMGTVTSGQGTFIEVHHLHSCAEILMLSRAKSK